MDNKYTDKELELILQYNYDPHALTKEQLDSIKNEELIKCIEYLKKYEAGCQDKKEKMDMIDPTFYIEIVEPEIHKVRETLLKYNSKQLPLDFYNNNFKKTVEILQEKINLELTARVNYLKAMKAMQNKK